MHILVINDDGPPSTQSSPYVHSLISTLQSPPFSHVVSVCLPHTQRSWISKAHVVGQTIKPSYFRPGTPFQDDGHVSARPFTDGEEQWILVDGTPASCAQIGLFHFFQEKGPIDLVISGPNYGRNTSALFSLSSGTIGGAMEAAVCGKRAIALSYAFESRIHDPEIIGKASNLSARLIGHLLKDWSSEIDLYSINVPLRKELLDGDPKILYVPMLENRWSSGSSFEEVEAENVDPAEQEREIREGGESSNAGTTHGEGVRHTHKHFKWAPKFADVHKSVKEAGPGSDGWAVMEGMVSVTPLKANFWHAGRLTGEIKLNPEDDGFSLEQLPNRSIRPSISKAQSSTQVYAIIKYPDATAHPYLIDAFSEIMTSNFNIIPSLSALSSLRSSKSRVLQITSYESIDFDDVFANPTASFVNAYVIRKALIRKHFLSATIASWITKHPESILKSHFKPSVDFELDYAEFLDDALIEAFELRESFERNERRQGGVVVDGTIDKEWWILKPSMSDGGNGIRLFSTYEELESIFQEWEPDSSSTSSTNGEANEDVDGDSGGGVGGEDSRIITSHLRHFTAQPYISPPLLLPSPPYNTRKFHIRTYVLAVGALTLYHYTDMLALFAAAPYAPPTTTSISSSPSSLAAHLTNTSLHAHPTTKPTSVHLCSSLPLPNHTHTVITTTIRRVLADLFLRAAPAQRTHFQPLPNAFELFGVDFLLDEEYTPWLLEVNAFPDLAQTGDRLAERVVGGLMRGLVRVVGGWVLGGGEREGGWGLGEKKEEGGLEGVGMGNENEELKPEQEQEEEGGRLVEIGRVDLGL